MKLILFLLIFLSGIFAARAWDQSDLEMFDLMEELKISFYDFLNVPSSAITADIKHAYRKLSFELHPDRNKHDPDAGVKFRQLSVIYQILRDEKRRERYDDALENGIPSWKTPVFYYRKLRKMSNFEIGAFVSVFIITIHFAALWGFAFERRWTLKERLQNHMKRHKASEKRKAAIDLEIEEQLELIKWPTFMDILPIALVRGFIRLILSIPAAFATLRGTVQANIEKVTKDLDERRELAKMLEERSKRKEQQKKRRMESSDKAWNNEEDPDYFNSPSFYHVTNLIAKNDQLAGTEDSQTENSVVSRPWSQIDELALIQLTNKYPGGFPNRWSTIAQILDRSVADVTSRAAKIATDLSSRVLINPLDDFHVDTTNNSEQINGGIYQDSVEDDEFYLSKRKTRRIGKADPKEYPSPVEEVIESEDMGEVQERNGNKDDDAAHISRRKQKASAKAKVSGTVKEMPAGGWTQKDQNQLETAMNSFPKGTPKRWQLIAECVPSKTLTEIMDRVKFLANRSKKRVRVEL